MVAEPIPSPSSIPVAVIGADPLSRAGAMSQLRNIPELSIVPDDVMPDDVVVLVLADEIDAALLAEVRALRGRGIVRIVLLGGRIDDKGVLAAAEAGVTGIVRRADATTTALARAIHAAVANEGSLPPDLLGRLLRQVGQLQRRVLSPRGLTFAGLTEREVAVLRLLADGYDTAEVATQLFYSERTVKNVIHDVTSRLELRNRTHAVAYAIRQGLI